MSARQIDPALFRETLGYFPTGVVVITAIDDQGEPAAMVVGSFTSVSLDPPLVAYLPTKTSGSYARLRTSSHFCVNVLAADQMELCGRLASRSPDKFAGVDWTLAPSGSPVLTDAVSWIECERESEIDGGDHYIVLGQVSDLAVQRASLPLLFFQGGYGRFALPSPVAPSDPELIEGVRLAEPFREPLRELASELDADCSIMTKVGDEAVFVMVDNHGDDEAGDLASGHRIPLIPPIGTVFYAHAPHHEVERWLARASASEVDEARCRTKLAAVRERGYSLSLLPGQRTDRVALMRDYSGTDVLPVHERRMRQMITESSSLYEPDLAREGSHDLHSVMVPVPTREPSTQVVVRLSRLPQGASTDEVERWTAALQRVAHHEDGDVRTGALG